MIEPFSKNSPVSLRFAEICFSAPHEIKLLSNRLKEFEKIRSALLDFYLVEEVVLYGSVTQGTISPDSDFDMLLICPQIEEELKKSPPFKIMNKFMTYLLSHFENKFRVIIDYPSITLINKNNLNQYDFTPAIPLRMTGLIRMEKDHKILKGKDEVSNVKIFPQKDWRIERSFEQIVGLLSQNSNYQKLVKIFKYWKNTYEDGIINLPSFFFNYICADANGGEESKKSIQELFCRYLLRLEIHCNIINQDLMKFSKPTSSCIDEIRKNYYSAKEAVNFETKKEYEAAMHCWNKVFNNDFIKKSSI